MQFRFHLDPPFNNPSKKSKALDVEATDLPDAQAKVERFYPEWRVNSFWPVRDTTPKPYDPEPRRLALERQPCPLEADPRLIRLGSQSSPYLQPKTV